MADKRVPRSLGRVDASGNVIPSAEFARAWDELFNGKGSASIGSLTAGVNQATGKLSQLEAGTLPVADVLISGRGSLNTQQDAQDNNTQSATAAASTAGGGSLVATVSPLSLTGNGAGEVTTGEGAGASATTCTVTPSGGTGPYTYAWTKVSGATVTVDAPTSATTSFTTTLSPGGFSYSVYRCTVTDSLSATATADVSVTLYDPAISL